MSFQTETCDTSATTARRDEKSSSSG